MNMLATAGSAPIVQAVGLALIHFSWQGFLLGSLLSLGLIAMRGRSADARYTICLSTMLLMLLAPIVTTAVILSDIPRALHGATDSVVWIQEQTLGTGWIVPLLPWLTGFWVLGASCLQLRLTVDWLRARRMQRIGVRCLPEVWRRELHELQARLGIRKAVRLLESSLISVPSVIGWSRPIILIPAGILSTLTPPQLRAVIAHELAHIRRHDYLANLLQNIFESILFFHPMTWWVSERMRAEREYCCDDVAVSACGNALNYAQALASLEEFRGVESHGALASTGGDLTQRISRMLESSGTLSAGRASWLPLVLSLTGVLAVMALIATGCDSDGIRGSGVVGPAEAAVEPTPSVAYADVVPVVAQLEECYEAGIMSAAQMRNCLEQLGSVDAAGNVVLDVEGEVGACRIIICAPGETGASCCPDGASVQHIRLGESLEDCIRRASDSKAGALPKEP